MKQLTKIKSVRFTEQQIEAFKTLEQYDVNVNQFIRSAVKEKLKREWKTIKEQKQRVKLPF
jgi:hypothetical protein